MNVPSAGPWHFELNDRTVLLVIDPAFVSLLLSCVADDGYPVGLVFDDSVEPFLHLFFLDACPLVLDDFFFALSVGSKHFRIEVFDAEARVFGQLAHQPVQELLLARHLRVLVCLEGPLGPLRVRVIVLQETTR